MALRERDPNASGRTSRASNMSAGSRGSRAFAQKNTLDMLSSAPGVSSMLRTSTELGNVGGIACDSTSTLPNLHRASNRSGANSRMSTGSSRSNNSRRDSRRTSSQYNPWERTSTGPRHSTSRASYVPQYVPDTLSPTVMDLPGSSPLIPRSRSSRDGRSRSMTGHTSHPNLALATNRSYSSLRTQDFGHRPRSPYEGYPQNFRRPGGARPESPATSDYTDAMPRRSGNQAWPRMRISSDMSARRDHRGQIIPPLRTRSPAYFANPNQHADVPPVPQIPSYHHHRILPQSRNVHKQFRRSTSSVFQNQRANSETPSSDGPSPPTPKDLVSPMGTQVLIDTGVTVTKMDQPSPQFYDGTEEYFEREEYVDGEANTAVVTGFRQKIKTITEERSSVEVPQQLNIARRQRERSEPPVPQAESIAELPASPVVPRRITRDMILAALGTVSPTEGTGMPAPKSEDRKLSKPAAKGEMEQMDSGTVQEEAAAEPEGQEDKKSHRHSMMSQPATSLLDSSTAEVALRYSSPAPSGTAKTGNGTTEDGMSELLDGYQHTEMKEDMETDEKGSSGKEPAENNRSHTPKSFDAQSFKSCTDLPELPDASDPAGKPRKDSDARSFKTCKDDVTPDRSMSPPVSRLPSSILLKSESRMQRPVSEVTLSSPPTILRKKPQVIPPRESSFPKVHSRIRASSKLSSTNASPFASISSSVDVAVQQPPPVPPRDSSTSKEAQRTTAVASYLLRGFRSGGRFASFGKRSIKNLSDISPRRESSDNIPQSDFPSNMREVQTSSPVQWRTEEARDSEKSSMKQETVSEKQTPNGLSPKESSSPTASTPPIIQRAPVATPVHRRPLSTPSRAVVEPSSVYSSDNNSSFKNRVQSFPAEFSKSPENNRRDSQSTTHLVWPGRKSLHLRSANISEPSPRPSSEQEETTTDLRLSSYRQPLGMHYLPDLKEESHEDSSLNTSASNLKNSSFRFPNGGQPSVRASVDETMLGGRNPSVRSARNSALAQTRGLPSMNFSRMDLVGNLIDFFDTRSTRSFDAVNDGREEITNDGLSRSLSDGGVGVRDKYRSVFAGLEGGEKTSGITQTAMDFASFKRRYTARDIMSDIENLDVPSVNGLSLRISELFPGLRGDSQREDESSLSQQELIDHVLEELQVVGGPAPKRSSARLRPVPGSPNMMVVEDAVYDELTGREHEGVDGDVDGEIAEGSSHGVTNGNTRSRGRTPLAELEAPCSSKLRPRSLSLGHRPSSRMSQRISQLSLPTTPTASTETHPWYNDKNFPWAATTVPSIDISLPARTALRRSASPRPGPSPLRSRLSESSEERCVSPNLPSGSAEAAPATSDGVGEGSSACSPEARNLCCLRGTPRDNKQDYNNKPTPPLFDNNGFLNGPLTVRGSDQSHEAGDRYPTSSLSPPSNVSLHNLNPQPPTRLSDSDDELYTPRRRKVSLRPRLTSLSRAAAASAPEFRVTQAENPSASSIPSFGDGRPTTYHQRRLTFNNAVGMSPREFRKSKFANAIQDRWDRFRERSRNLFNRITHRTQDPATKGAGSVSAPISPPRPVDSNMDEDPRRRGDIPLSAFNEFFYGDCSTGEGSYDDGDPGPSTRGSKKDKRKGMVFPATSPLKKSETPSTQTALPPIPEEPDSVWRHGMVLTAANLAALRPIREDSPDEGPSQSHWSSSSSSSGVKPS